MNDRFFKNNVISGFDPNTTFIRVDSPGFRSVSTISLERVGEILKIQVNEDLAKNLEAKNVSSLEYSGQSENPFLFPSNMNISHVSYFSVDENYLYVWTEKLKKWKRIPLSDWEETKKEL